MNSFLIDSILSLENGFTATILSTEGHSYKKRGQRAVYEVGDIAPVFGNLGSLCVDAEILEKGERAVLRGRPMRLKIDLQGPGEVVFGYGTACGGVLTVLIEPVRGEHKKVYRELEACVEAGERCWLSHDVESGRLELGSSAPAMEPSLFVEDVEPLQKIFLFGATPLAGVVIHQAQAMSFAIHVVDWRPAHLDGFAPLRGVRTHTDLDELDAGSFLAVLSHSFERDLTALRAGLETDCRYVGLLASSPRREKVFAALLKEGVEPAALERIHSPIGLAIGARSDPEIALAILAQMIQELRT
jgi:xanthine dehydrogenase accessory factor